MSEAQDLREDVQSAGAADNQTEIERRFDRALQMMKEGLEMRKAAGIEPEPRPGLIILPPRKRTADTETPGQSSE